MVEAPAESEKGDIRRSPDRVVVRRYVSRPPVPLVFPIYPAAIVVRRPAPRLVRDPSPAIVGIPGPAAVAVRSPIPTFVRLPHVAVIRDLGPAAVAVEVLCARVIAVSVLPACGAENLAVAVLVPPVPIVFRPGVCDLILGAVAALDGYELALFNCGAALRHGNFRLAAEHGQFRLIGGVHLNAIATRAERM